MRRLLRSPLVDLLVGPHGVDRYLELIRPSFTVNEARAEIIGVRRQTPRSVTLTLRPNAAWRGFAAGQFVRMGVEIDGVRRTRTYSPAGSALAGDGRLELTATVHPEGLVSGNLFSRVRPGTIVHLGPAQGEFVLPDVRPERLALISGGSGITPVLSILRTLCDEGYAGDVSFIHFARTRADWLYRAEVEALAAARGNLNVSYVATREGGGRLCEDDLAGRYAAVCGAQSLLDAARSLCEPGRLLTETFTPPSLSLSGAAASGELRFVGSGVAVPIGAGTLLEQAEAAGLSPEFGCRMGICRTCTCRKTAGAVRNVLTDEISEEETKTSSFACPSPPGTWHLRFSTRPPDSEPRFRTHPPERSSCLLRNHS